MEELNLNWDVLVQCKAVLQLPKLRQLTMSWVKDLTDGDLDELDEHCPLWATVTLQGKQYARFFRGLRVMRVQAIDTDLI